MDDTKPTTEELYNRYASLIYRRARQILYSEDEAWDATQEVFLKYIEKSDTIQDDGAILGWLYRTCTNHCISRLRKKQGVALEENIHADTRWQSSQETKLVMKTLMTKLMQPWNQKVREAVSLIYIDGFKQEEVAKLMGIGESTVRKYLLQFKTTAQKWRPEIAEVLGDL